MKSEDPLVSIIVSTKNRFDEFMRCLKSVQEHTKVPYELIIIDAGSTDQTRKWLTEGHRLMNGHHRLTLLLEPPVPGYAQGNNMAMRVAKGKYIYLLNNDNWVTDRWLEPMIELYERDPSIGHMSSLILWPDGAVQSAGAKITRDGASISLYGGVDYRSVPEGPIECDYAGFGLYRKDVLEQVGYLSEDYYPIYFDDTDYGLKVKIAKVNYPVSPIGPEHILSAVDFKGNPILSENLRRNYRVVCCPQSIIYHACSNEGRERWDKEDAYGRNHKIFIEKWGAYLMERGRGE